MSCTTIVAVYPNEKCVCEYDLTNAWGSAPVIWDYLCRKYFYGELWAMMAIHDDMKKLWGLAQRQDVPQHLRAVLVMTFDRFYVSKANYARAAADIEQFVKECPATGNVNHWPTIAKLFRDDPEFPGIGFWLTSVTDNPFNGAYNEETEEYGPPDWDKVYEVYEQLDALLEYPL